MLAPLVVPVGFRTSTTGNCLIFDRKLIHCRPETLNGRNTGLHHHSSTRNIKRGIQREICCSPETFEGQILQGSVVFKGYVSNGFCCWQSQPILASRAQLINPGVARSILVTPMCPWAVMCCFFFFLPQGPLEEDATVGYRGASYATQ